VDVASSSGEAAIVSLPEHDSPSDIETLLSAHFGFIWRVLRRGGLCPADADDATQQVFMIAATKLDRMTRNHERAYLYGIARKVRGRVHRTTQRRREVPIEDAEERADASRGPEQTLAMQDARRLLDDILEKIPEKLRRVLVLVEVEELEVAEVAVLERIPLGTAASRLRLGRERFRTLLAQHAARNPFGDTK
jgi:RNA polymerase sigma-70 factor (ECF subfamily)